MADDKKLSEMLFENRDIFRRLVETTKSGIYIADTMGNLAYVNHAFVEILGYSTKEEVLGKNLAHELYANPRDREVFLQTMEKTGFVRDYEVKNMRKDASVVILSATSHFIYNDAGGIIGVEGIVQDITEKKKLEENLLSEKNKLEEILGFDEKISSIRKFDRLIDFIVEKTAGILEADRCSLMLFDEDKQELCIQGARGLNEEIIKTTRIKLGEPIAGVVAQERRAVVVPNIEYDERFKRGNRSGYKTRSFMIMPIVMGNKLLGVINVSDKRSDNKQEPRFNATDLKILSAIAREVAVALENVKLYKELNYLTVIDPVTNIFNHRYFMRTLNYEIKRTSRSKGALSVLMFDIDDFKAYNDSFGHPEGDELLKKIGELSREQLRETDIVCRYAGDEFAVILPETNLEGARIAAEKIRKSIEGHAFKRTVTLSIGVTSYKPGNTEGELIMRSDQALYQAKRDGKNRVASFD